MPIFPFFGRRAARAIAERAARDALERAERQNSSAGAGASTTVRRHFYNEPSFQTYASFFPLWSGWATAGHCMSESADLPPPFARGDLVSWPGGLDAALLGCTLPRQRPGPPRRGQRVVAQGYPAGSRHVERRQGAVYFERSPGQWICQLDDADEPVVTGMSGGPVVDAASGEPIGILITRNSPADLDSDGDADESFDFIALDAVWDAVNSARIA